MLPTILLTMDGILTMDSTLRICLEVVGILAIVGVLFLLLRIFDDNDLTCTIVKTVSLCAMFALVLYIMVPLCGDVDVEEYEAAVEKINCDNTWRGNKYSVIFRDADGEIHSADVKDAYALLLQEGDAVTILIENKKTPLTHSTYCTYSVKSISAETSTLAKIFSFD